MALQVWTEKYRPKTLSEVIGQRHAVERLQAWVKEGSIPNMLFSGSAGTGKTSVAISLAKDLYGEHWRENFCEFNASDERGIDVVRGRIKDFARTKPLGADFKIIFLDESDALTPEAQQALRRTMERYAASCRFILSCVTPDTKILLPEEIEISIREFMKNFKERKTLNVTTFCEKKKNIDNNQVLCVIKMNPRITNKKVIEITTMSGRKLKVTTDHPILTSNGWKIAGNLDIDEKIIVFPHLEGLEYESNDNFIFNYKDFLMFLKRKEMNSGCKSIASSQKSEELYFIGKEKILKRIKELYKIIQSGEGLTIREYDIYKIIKKYRNPVCREIIQKRIGLSRMRVIQLLKGLEKKGFIKRYVNEFDSKEHLFKITCKKPILLRNKMDIKRIIQKEYNINICFTEITKLLGVRKIYKKDYYDRTIDKLNNCNLLKLKYNSKEIGALTRIFSFIFGDGHITKGKRTIIFTGNEKVLKEVKKDLEIIGFAGSQITKKTIKQNSKGRSFTGVTTSFFLNSDILIRLFEFLGAPIGDKIVHPYHIPEWIMNGTKFVKREFLRVLFGCEGYAPEIKKRNFEAVTLKMHKSRKLKRNMVYFFKQLQSLLIDFGIESYIKIYKLDYQRKDGHIMDNYSLILKSSNKNMFHFFSQIGYAYERKKDILSRIASEYLRHKLYTIKQREVKAKKIINGINQGMAHSELIEKYDCSYDFIYVRKKGKPVHLSRDFPTFIEWERKFHFVNGFLFNKISEIKEIDCNDVMDITCFRNHNFIANGIVSHNCNYSSRLIEPVQSRCAVFRFKNLSGGDVKEYVNRIVKGENLKVSEDGIKAIYEICSGDLRKATNLVQAASTLGDITRETVYEVASQAKPQDVKEMVLTALSGNFVEARKKLYDLLINQGLSGSDIVRSIHREIFSLDIPDDNKIQMVEKTGEYEFRLNQGSSEEIQLEALLAQFMRIGK